jgi:hypothetical protein
MKTTLTTDGKKAQIAIEPETVFERILAETLRDNLMSAEIVISKDTDDTIFINIKNKQ